MYQESVKLPNLRALYLRREQLDRAIASLEEIQRWPARRLPDRAPVRPGACRAAQRTTGAASAGDLVAGPIPGAKQRARR
jgi:hypothetical protein